MSRVRAEVLSWFSAHLIAPGEEFAALRATGMIPSPRQWRTFLEQIALWLGTLALAAAVIYFFAFNWQDMSRFTKFGLVEGAIVAALLTCYFLDLDKIPGKAVLILLSLLVGALLALSGQIYQTGADTFELFTYWAALILPWVLVSRFVPLWLLWLAILNLALILYFSLGRDTEAIFWAPLITNSMALIAWEAAHRAGVSWVRESWPPRLIAVASAAAATALILWAILDGRGASALLAVVAYAAWVAGLYGWYRRARLELFMLAAGLLSLIVAVASFLSDKMLDSGGAAYLLIGLIVIGMSAAGAIWLKSLAQEPAA